MDQILTDMVEKGEIKKEDLALTTFGKGDLLSKTPEEHRFCTCCGRVLEKGANYCGSCGKNL